MLNRKAKITSLFKVVAHGDPDVAILQEVTDALVGNGLTREWAELVATSIGRMDLRALNEKIKRMYRPEYGWQHSCGESYHQLDSPGDPCPSCGEQGDWEYFDRTIEKES